MKLFLRFIFPALFIFCCLFLLESCERKFKVLDSKKKKVESLSVNVENLIGTLSVFGEKRYLVEVKNFGFMGDISTNFDGSNLSISLKNLSGETRLILNNKRKINFDALITGGNLKVYGSKLNFERMYFDINGGALDIDLHNPLNLIISNNVGNVKIRILKYLPVRLRLSSVASLLNIPEEFVLSNGIFYYLESESNFIDMDIYVKMGSVEISF
ncbi:MAG: hypothetical protein ACP5QT_05285 [Brevinematia bacterium]